MDKRSGQAIFTKEYRSQFKSFVGVDLHKSTVTLAAVDSDQVMLRRQSFPTKCVEKIETFLVTLPGPVWMAVEAVGFAEWFVDRFRDNVARIDLADATELALRRGKRRKSDPNDSLDAAMRLAVGDCPLGWLASPEVMRLRKLGRHWRRLSRTLSRAKHGMKSILNATNLAGPKFDGASAQRWLLAHGHLLKPTDHDCFSDLLDVILLLDRQREKLRRTITFANREDFFRHTVELLKSIPGIDEIWACIITAEIGRFDRFPNADALEFWSGLTPDNQESAGRTQSGHITKAGSATLRWALCNAALTLCRSDASQEKIRQRLIKRVGKPRANVAMARRLLRLLYAMVRDNKPYERGRSRNHTAGANAARAEKIAATRRKQNEPIEEIEVEEIDDIEIDGDDEVEDFEEIILLERAEMVAGE